MLGDELIGNGTVDHRRRRQSAASVGGRNTMGRALVGHEDVEDVVDKRGDRQRVDGLQWDS